MRTLVFIPAWNEVASVDAVIADVHAQLDADGRHPAAEVARLLTELREDRADLSRLGGTSFLTPLRSAFFIITSLFVNVGLFKPRHAEAGR